MWPKKKPVLTKTLCAQLEKLRQAIEVLTGSWVKFVEIDFNTCCGRVNSFRQEYEIAFTFGSDILSFKLDYLGWHIARFDDAGRVRVIHKTDPNRHLKTDHSMWWVGLSADKRWLEPLYPEHVEQCAKERGLTVDEYLKS